jgi:hypothetical protein
MDHSLHLEALDCAGRSVSWADAIAAIEQGGDPDDYTVASTTSDRLGTEDALTA